MSGESLSCLATTGLWIASPSSQSSPDRSGSITRMFPRGKTSGTL